MSLFEHFISFMLYKVEVWKVCTPNITSNSEKWSFFEIRESPRYWARLSRFHRSKKCVQDTYEHFAKRHRSTDPGDPAGAWLGRGTAGMSRSKCIVYVHLEPPGRPKNQKNHENHRKIEKCDFSQICSPIDPRRSPHPAGPETLAIECPGAPKAVQCVIWATGCSSPQAQAKDRRL